MEREGRDKIERQAESITPQDIATALASSVVERVTPLAHLSYPQQLEQKHAWLRGVLDGFATQMRKDIESGSEATPNWFRQQPQIPLDDVVIHSEAIDEYRNKVEFTIGMRYDLEK